MPGANLNGFDIVLELGGERIADLLTTYVPLEVNQSFTFNGISIPVSLRDVSVVGGSVGIRPGGLVDVAVRYSTTSLMGNSLGSATIRATVRIADDGGNPRRFTFTVVDRPTLELADPSRLDALIGLAQAAGIDITREQALVQAGEAIQRFINESAPALPPVPLATFGTPPCAVTLTDIRVHTVAGAAMILARFEGANITHPSAPNPGGFAATNLNGRAALLSIANEALFGVVSCALTQPGSPLAGASLGVTGESLVLQRPHSTTVQGQRVNISALSLAVNTAARNELLLTGRADTSGTGWGGDGSFSAVVELRSNPDGSLRIVLDTNRIQTNVSVWFEWWVYLIGFFAAGIVGLVAGPLVAIVVAVAVAAASTIASAIATAIAGNSLAGLAGQAEAEFGRLFTLIPPELRRALGVIRIDDVLFDDLELRGTWTAPARPWLRIHDQRSPVRLGLLDESATSSTHLVRWEHSFEILSGNLIGALQVDWWLEGQHLGTRGASGEVRVGGELVPYAISPTGVLSLTTPAPTDENDRFVVPVRLRVVDAAGLALTASALINDDAVSHMLNPGIFDMIPLPWRAHFIPIPPEPDPWIRTEQILVRDGASETLAALSRGMQVDVRDLSKRLGMLRAKSLGRIARAPFIKG